MQAIDPRAGITKSSCIHSDLFLDHDLHLGFKELLGEELRRVLPALVLPFRTGIGDNRGGSGRLKTFFLHEIPGEFLVFAKHFHRVKIAATRLRLGPPPHRGGQKRINSERLVSQRARLSNPFSQLLGRTGCSSQDSQASCIGDRSCQTRHAGPTHSCQKNRILDSQHFANAASKSHLYLPFSFSVQLSNRYVLRSRLLAGQLRAISRAINPTNAL